MLPPDDTDGKPCELEVDRWNVARRGADGGDRPRLIWVPISNAFTRVRLNPIGVDFPVIDSSRCSAKTSSQPSRRARSRKISKSLRAWPTGSIALCIAMTNRIKIGTTVETVQPQVTEQKAA